MDEGGPGCQTLVGKAWEQSSSAMGESEPLGRSQTHLGMQFVVRRLELELEGGVDWGPSLIGDDLGRLVEPECARVYGPQGWIDTGYHWKRDGS